MISSGVGNEGKNVLNTHVGIEDNLKSNRKHKIVESNDEDLYVDGWFILNQYLLQGNS